MKHCAGGDLLMNLENDELRKLIGPYTEREIYSEVMFVCEMAYPDMKMNLVKEVFDDVLRLFAGEYEGYRESNTSYHNSEHTLSVFLAMARVMNGARLSGEAVTKRNMELGLISSLFHDTGLIQEAGDMIGTGAKHTVGHEERSADLLSGYLGRRGRNSEDISDCRSMIFSTILGKEISEISFRNKEIELIGKCLAACDLLGQMADPEYLSKLTLLFYEFEEASVPGFDSELMLIEKTQSFYDYVVKLRLETLGDITGYMKAHFKSRHGKEVDPYEASVEANLIRLREVLDSSRRNYERRFERGGVIW